MTEKKGSNLEGPTIFTTATAIARSLMGVTEGPQQRTMTVEVKKEKAMEDLRHEAANRQGNYVRVLAVSAHGGAVRGIAYRCK